MSNDEWEKRQLCSDGNCIGVIGPDGRCKECGLPGEGDYPPTGGVGTDPDEDVSVVSEDTEETVGQDLSEEPVADSDDDDWTRRRLCPDGNCIGVIGPDGCCKECGRNAE